ncbi:MAG: sugar phosphorylase, partial [Chloroflexi bacterium]|nr:sugar phosphorylase [Chloroflexota bacterium]
MSTDQSMRDKVTFLYPGDADSVYQRLRALLDDFKARHPAPAPPSPRFSENDVVLISYADHVQEPGEKTLETMRRFLDRYVEGVIPRVHFLPFYPYSSDDGFSVIDYYLVKSEFGDWTDVSHIAADFELMFDLVINHASAKSEWFQRFLADDPKYRDFFIAFDHPVDVSSVFRPRTHPLLTPFETQSGERYVWTTFSEDQIDVNFANPDVLLEYINITLFYVEHGATIIRLDAIAYLWKQLGTSSLHLPQTHTAVKLMRDILDEVAPNVWIITETNVPHQENISYFGNGEDEAHLVYNFALPPLLLYSLIKGDAAELTRWAQSLTLPSRDTAFFNFTASHDGIGVTALRAMVSPDEFQEVLDAVSRRGGRVNYRTVPGQEPVPYELNIVYLDAVGGPEPFIASQAIALALQGVPAVYFNSLIGARNWGEGVDKLGYNRAVNRQKFAFGELSAELDDKGTARGGVYHAYRRLLEVRRGEPLFSPLAQQSVLELDPHLFAVLRSDGSDRLLSLVNVSDQEVSL